MEHVAGSEGALTVRCRFDDCDRITLFRVVMATVDQLCASTNISLALLESLEVPLGEALVALHPFGVDSVLVSVEEGSLHLTIELRDPTGPERSTLFDDDSLIEAFFEVGGGPSDVELVGSLA